MATTTKSLSARIVAGFGAVALATLAAFGTALPASAAANLDENADASLSIYALEQPVASGAQPHSGAAIADLSGYTPIVGVTYRVQRILDIDLTDNADWASLPGLDADAVAADAANLSAAVQAITGSTGLASFPGLDVGAYVVQEVVSAPTPGGPSIVVPSQPFIVTLPQAVENAWEYNVHVYPKSTRVAVDKSVEDFAPAGLGSTLTWTISSGAPLPTQWDDIRTYAITDRLDSRLSLTGASPVRVSVTDGTTPVAVTDFVLTAPSAANDRTLRIEFGADALDAFDATKRQTVVVEIDTVVTSVGNGLISNTATVVVNGASLASQPEIDRWGAVELFAHDGTPARTPLAGAKFQLVDSAGNPVEVMVDGAMTDEFTSDADGVVSVPGLRTTESGTVYRLVVVEAPSGFQMPAANDRTRDLETVAGSTPDEFEAEMAFSQVPAYALPITGGAGQAAFMIGGAGLLLGAFGFMLVRRRKAAEQG